MRKETFISKLKFEFVRRQKNCAYLKQKLQEGDQTLRRSQELRTEVQFMTLMAISDAVCIKSFVSEGHPTLEGTVWREHVHGSRTACKAVFFLLLGLCSGW